VSYFAQWLLTWDTDFAGRGRACLTQQADVFKDDARADLAALAESILRQESGPLMAFQVLLAATPGFADTVIDGNNVVNSGRIADDDILAAVQAQWPTVARLYYDPDGTPIAIVLPRTTEAERSSP
jgi:hypothetical protein